MKRDRFDPGEIETFLQLQQRSFSILRHVAAGLAEGDDEREVSKRVGRAMRDSGVTHYFHPPVALFGARTAFEHRTDWKLADFYPRRSMKLARGMPVILDVSPIWDGFTVDTSYAFEFGSVPGYATIKTFNLGLRETILQLVLSGLPARDLVSKINTLITDAGYFNCHRLHPEHVLGHQVTRMDAKKSASLTYHRSALHQLAFFVKHAVADRVPGFPNRSPLLNVRSATNHPLPPGLWAMEPHIAKNNVGVKWEELLVVTQSDAYWLDPVPPLDCGSSPQ